MLIFNVVNRQNLLFSETMPQRKTIILLKNTYFVENFQGYQNISLLLKKLLI
jgi:hypothetical protein